jgi:hypothetical protein
MLLGGGCKLVLRKPVIEISGVVQPKGGEEDGKVQVRKILRNGQDTENQCRRRHRVSMIDEVLKMFKLKSEW